MTHKENTKQYPTDLTDAQWALLAPLLPEQEGAGRPREVDLRRVIDALMYIDRTGCQWRMLPLDFPPSGTVRYYYDQWRLDGTLLDIHDALRRQVRHKQGRHEEPSAIIVDSQTVKTTEAGGPRGFDGGKQIQGRKRHISVDTEGNLLVAQVGVADEQDRAAAEALLRETSDMCPSVQHAWADGGYTGDVIDWAKQLLKITIEIVKRAPEQVGFVVLPRRWVVERSFAWLGRCRRLSKDYEHDPASSMAMMYWASIQRMLRYLAPPKGEKPYCRKKASVALVAP